MSELQVASGNRAPYEGKRHSDRLPLSPQQAADIHELESGLPLSRHEWLQEMIDNTPQGERYSQADAYVHCWVEWQN